MNIGSEIVKSVLESRTMTPVLEAGFNSSWLTGVGTGSEVILTGEDRKVYEFLLHYWKRHHKVPSLGIFRENYPVEIYPFSAGDPYDLEELVDLASDKVNSFLVADMITRVIDLHDEGRIDSAISLIKSEGTRLGTDIRYRKAKADNLNDPNFDLEGLLSRNLERGIPFGIYTIDEEFFGFQPGQLITLLGRQKSGKTTLTLNSALNAWKEGYTVLFFSVEMDLDMLRQRLLSLGSHVSPSRMRRGHLRESEKTKVRDFHHQLTNLDDEDEGRFFISKKRSMITVDDVKAEVHQYNPNIVYVDGFSFMVDKDSGKTTDDWQAHERVAAALKTLALDESITVFVNHQVQEKQYSPKYGIQASTIAGGTGLLKASDLVIGADKTGGLHTLNCVLSRYEYFENTVLEIDWDTMSFTVYEDSQPDLEGSGI